MIATFGGCPACGKTSCVAMECSINRRPGGVNYIPSISKGYVAQGTEQKVIALIEQRQKLGVAKYGTTVADNPLVLKEWLQHQLEELLDAAIYVQRAIDELDKK